MRQKDRSLATRRRILEVARRLFLEKGYDDTTIHDIVAQLGMTKGAIYHHFPSKYAILTAMIEDNVDTFSGVCYQVAGRTGFEKLQNLLRESWRDVARQQFIYDVMMRMNNPRFLGEYYLDVMNEMAPEVQKLVEEGVADGSIVSPFADDVSEILLLLFNIWIWGHIISIDTHDLQRQLKLVQHLLESIDVPLFTDELLSEANHVVEQLKKRHVEGDSDGS